jgi:hypothetical protein
MVLDRAAVFADTSIEELEKASRSLAKNIDAGARGGAKQAEMFERLGTSANELIDLTLPEQLLRIADGMAMIENHTEKTATALALFGKSGGNMLQLLADSGGLLAKSMAEVQEYVGFFSSQELNGIGAANDAWDRLSMTFSGVFQKIAAMMSPALERLYLNLADAIKPGTALNWMFMSLARVATLTVNVINELVGFFSFLSEGTGKVTGRFLATIVVATALMSAYRGLILLLGILRVRTAALAVWEAARAGINIKTAAVLLTAGAATVAFSNEINKAVNSLLGMMDAQVEVNSGLEDFIDLRAKAEKRSVNLGSAAFGSQSALEQLFTVRSDTQAIAGVENGINESNQLLRQIRDGINAAEGAVDVQFEEVDL